MKKVLLHLVFLAYLFLAAFGLDQFTGPHRSFSAAYFWAMSLAPLVLAFIAGLLLMLAEGRGLFTPGPGRRRLSLASLLITLLLLILAFYPFWNHLLPQFLFSPAFHKAFDSRLHLPVLLAFAAGIALTNAFRRE